jgi:hypothetical protein
MPVLWAVTHATRLVTITFKGVICRQDVDDCADGIMTPATLSYRKLVDLTQGSLPSSPAVMAAFVEHAREHGRSGVMGPLAIVTLPGAHRQHAGLFQALSSAADRPLRVFSDAQAARLAQYHSTKGGSAQRAPVRDAAVDASRQSTQAKRFGLPRLMSRWSKASAPLPDTRSRPADTLLWWHEAPVFGFASAEQATAFRH